MKKSGFTIIEVLIAVLVFGLWLIAAYVLTSAASALSLRSKQEIIATNLLREQLELAKNVRNSNFLAYRNFDQRKDVNKTQPCTETPCIFDAGYYTFGNRYNFTSDEMPVQTEKLGISTTPWPSNAGNSWKNPGVLAHKAKVVEEAQKLPLDSTFRYCIDDAGRYRFDCSGANTTMTPYYGFVLIRPLQTGDASGTDFTVTGALTLDAYFATTEGGYREFTMSTILTDFKKK